MVKGKLMRKIYFAGGKMLSLLNNVIPKNENKILIFCKGPLCDNSEALFHFLLKGGYQARYQIICVVDKPSRYKEYQQENVIFVTLKQSLTAIFTAKYNFFHGEMLAIKPTKKQVWVNYWHGTPLKKINHMLDKLGDYDYDFFTYLTAAEERFVPIMAEAFDCDIQKVIVCGHPRNDYLFSKNWELGKLSIQKERYQKIALWMPTYRKSRDGTIVDTKEGYLKNGALPIFHTEEMLKELNDFLKEQNILLLVKFHPAQNLDNFQEKNFSHMIFLTHRQMIEEQIVLYRLVKDVDCLITDYSSIFFDYLLLDRPIGFTIEDMAEYRDSRGFVFDNPLDYMPGQSIGGEEDFKKFLLDCVQGKDKYKNERSNVNSKVNHFQDGENCRRLLDRLGVYKN
ncbi:MAG: CDP-glycerol glycerophosphotransferase family protein [Lachnospiraceae bacterium]|nr:CDP-glycerol glycerophosphotransferase family protein [Lachnospiraceae bacterium]